MNRERTGIFFAWFFQWHPLHVCAHRALYKLRTFVCERCYESESLTVGFQCQWRRRAQNPCIRHRVLHQTNVASDVRGLHLGDVQVSCVLGDEATAVLGHEWGELIEHPAVHDLYRGTEHRTYRLESSCLFWLGPSVCNRLPCTQIQSYKAISLLCLI